MGRIVVQFRRTIVVVIIAGILLVLAGWGVDRLILPGFSSARSVPPASEIAIASWLLRASVPAKEALRANPLPATAENITAGAQIFQRHCAVCHAYDGSGANAMGRGEYPPVPPLGGPSIAAQSDGELFYHIRNGIRYTGMPAWDLPASAIWQAILFIRHLPVTAILPRAMAAQNGATAKAAATETPHYVGSAACASCHRDIFARWNKTRMAHVVSDPRASPSAVSADLASAPATMKPAPGDADLVYGSRWKQRFFKKIGNDYYVLPVQWDIVHQRWLTYFVAEDEDWWARLYPPDNAERPTGPLCDGCHSVNYDIQTHAVTEWNVGCERCHGPGSNHLADPRRETIINPARLDAFAANDTCLQCHSQGRPRDNPKCPRRCAPCVRPGSRPPSFPTARRRCWRRRCAMPGWRRFSMRCSRRMRCRCSRPIPGFTNTVWRNSAWKQRRFHSNPPTPGMPMRPRRSGCAWCGATAMASAVSGCRVSRTMR